MTETGEISAGYGIYPQLPARAVKVFVKDEIRRFTVVGASVNQLRAELKALLNIPSDQFIVRYQDEEGDWISIGSEAELQHGFHLAGSKALRLRVDENSTSLQAPQRTLSSDVVAPFIASTPSPVLVKKAWKEFKEEAKAHKKELKFAKVEAKKELKAHLKAAKCDWKSKKHLDDNPLNARFVKHVTAEDYYEFAPGTAFVKTWRFRNEGSLPWPENCVLLCVSKRGDQMGTTGSVTLTQAVVPGQEVDISVSMIAPVEPGSYSGYWRLAEPSGRKFGQRVRVLIKVVGSSSSEEETTPSAWNATLNQLEAMGFKNKSLNVKMLIKSHGEIEKVIHKLVKREQKMSGVNSTKH